MTSEDRDTAYEETVSRTTSDPDAVARETAEERKFLSTPSETEVKTFEVETVQDKEEESISAKAKEAGRSLKDLVSSLGRKAKAVTEEKAGALKAKAADISAKADARDIQNLGSNTEQLITVFEDTMTEIRKKSYDEQEKLLLGYKKLLEEQINVINARMNLARRLKPGA